MDRPASMCRRDDVVRQFATFFVSSYRSLRRRSTRQHHQANDPDDLPAMQRHIPQSQNLRPIKASRQSHRPRFFCRPARLLFSKNNPGASLLRSDRALSRPAVRDSTEPRAASPPVRVTIECAVFADVPRENHKLVLHSHTARLRSRRCFNRSIRIRS